MDDRTHEVLDGMLSRDQLTAAEAADLAAAEAEIGAVLRTVATQPVDVAPVVMRRIADAEAHPSAAPPAPAAVHAPSPVRALLGWIWKPRPIALAWRPAYGFAAAAIVMALLLFDGTAPSPDGAPQVLTQFVLEAPDARQVMLAGDFTGWEPAHTMTRTEPGVWTVFVPLDPGVHSYAFVVDGERWVPDPNAPAVEDGFGGLNSRLAVIAPDEAES